MSQFAKVLNADEIAQLQAMEERIKGTRPEERGPPMLMHFAVEDAISALMCIGNGNASCSNSFRDIGESVRKAVLTG